MVLKNNLCPKARNVDSVGAACFLHPWPRVVTSGATDSFRADSVLIQMHPRPPGTPVDASQFWRLSSSFGLFLTDGAGKPSQDFRSDTMDKKKLEGFKKRLETRQQELRRTVSRTQADGRSADEDTAQDIADRAASSYTKEFLFSQSNNERQLLQMVDKALARIREGSFGECIHCGKEINAKRLEAVPWTRHCIECQEKLEQGLLEEAQH